MLARMIFEPGFAIVLLIGLMAVTAIGAVACAGFLMWCAMLLSKIEHNQRERG